MTQQAAYWRLFLICLAAAAGETIAHLMNAYDLTRVVGLIFGAAAYVLTQGTAGPPGRRRGEIRYWRGRRVDDDDGPRRWN